MNGNTTDGTVHSGLTGGFGAIRVPLLPFTEGGMS